MLFSRYQSCIVSPPSFFFSSIVPTRCLFPFLCSQNQPSTPRPSPIPTASNTPLPPTFLVSNLAQFVSRLDIPMIFLHNLLAYHTKPFPIPVLLDLFPVYPCYQYPKPLAPFRVPLPRPLLEQPHRRFEAMNIFPTYFLYFVTYIQFLIPNHP